MKDGMKEENERKRNKEINERMKEMNERDE